MNSVDIRHLKGIKIARTIKQYARLRSVTEMRQNVDE